MGGRHGNLNLLGMWWSVFPLRGMRQQMHVLEVGTEEMETAERHYIGVVQWGTTAIHSVAEGLN